MTPHTPSSPTRFVNHVPEGRPAWLSYGQFNTLRMLTDALAQAGDDPGASEVLHDFLTRVAGLALPQGIQPDALHATAFTLIRRGYAVEALSPADYGALRVLFRPLERPAPGDMTLPLDSACQRLHTHLTVDLSLDVAPGRGPVWHRANDLLTAYEARHAGAVETALDQAERIGQETRAMLDMLLATVSSDERPAVAAILAKHLSASVLDRERRRDTSD